MNLLFPEFNPTKWLDDRDKLVHSYQCRNDTDTMPYYKPMSVT